MNRQEVPIFCFFSYEIQFTDFQLNLNYDVVEFRMREHGMNYSEIVSLMNPCLFVFQIFKFSLSALKY